MTITVELPRIGTAQAFRDAAQQLASHRVPPAEVCFTVDPPEQGLFADPPPLGQGPQDVRVPKNFPALADTLCCIRSGEGFAVAYGLLHRLQTTKGLLSNRAEASVARAEELAKKIRRDKHKMKAFLRFRDLAPGREGRRRFHAWFEPSHRIEEPIAGFFCRRFGDMDWIIRTPEVTLAFRDGALHTEAMANTRSDDSDDLEAFWQTYYRSIFNPARLKVKAMQAEMPKKYWKNMPEAALIPDLIEGARRREDAMRTAAPTEAPKRAGRITPLFARSEPSSTVAVATLGDLPAALSACTRCDLHCHATQPVPGEGPADARVMIVGEQPGDQEDLAGRPFVGPAGQLFDAVAEEAGLVREKTYLTNAVKHFKFTPRGKRRIHQRPNAGEVARCKWWLDLERRLVAPDLIVAMGATAAQALTGNGKDLMKRRGGIEQSEDGTPVLITMHPSYLLRQQDPAQADRDRALFKADLARAAGYCSDKSTATG